MSHFKKVLNQRLGNENITFLSKKLNIPRSTLNFWMNGGTPSLKNIEQLKALATHLGLTLDELLIDSAECKLITAITFSDDDKQFKIRVERIK